MHCGWDHCVAYAQPLALCVMEGCNELRTCTETFLNSLELPELS